MPDDGDMTVEEAEELEMELELASFENSLPDDVEMQDTHRIAFRAGFTQARRASPSEGPLEAIVAKLRAYAQRHRDGRMPGSCANNRSAAWAFETAAIMVEAWAGVRAPIEAGR